MRRDLAAEADRILQQDGKLYREGGVRSLVPNKIERSFRKEQHQARRRALEDQYRALPVEQQRKLRVRYRRFNPEKSTVMATWFEWLEVELEKIDGMPMSGTGSIAREDGAGS